MSVLRRAYVQVLPELDGFDRELLEKLRSQDPGGKAGKQVGGQLNRALKRLHLDPIDIKANPRDALAKIDETEARLLRLSRESPTVDVKIRIDQGLAQLRRFRKQIGDLGEQGGEEAATGFAARFATRLGPVLASAPIGPAAAGAGVLGLALAPSIAAGIGAGIAAGAGAAAIGAGIALVAKDPVIADKAKTIGKTFATGIAKEAVTFRQPVLESLGQIQLFAERSVPKIGQAFRNSSPAVVGLTRDITRAGDALLNAFVVASSRSGPPLKALGGLIAAVGAATGGMIDTLSQDSKAGASAIDDLTNALVNFIRGTTEFVHGLAQIKSGLDSFDNTIDSIRAKAEDRTLASWLDLTADGYKKNSEAAKLYRQGLIGVAGSVNDYNAYLRQQNIAQGRATAVMSVAIATEDDLKSAQDAVTQSQQGLSNSLAVLTSRQSRAQLASDTLKQAMNGLYGATGRAADANVAYEASWDNLTAAVGKNKRSLDIHTVAGRTNRAALQALVVSTNEAYLADIAAGVAIDKARQKHDNRIRSIEKETGRLGLDKKATQEVINTYGRIPSNKTTNILLSGVNKIANTLVELYVYQRSLAEGIPLASARAGLKNAPGPDKRFGGFAEGGWTGPGAKYQPAGMVHADEFVIRKDARRSIERSQPGLLQEMNATGQVPGYASGGLVAPVETRDLLYRTNLLHTKILSKAQVAAKVIGQFGDWPSSPSAQRGDSGVWRRIVALIKSTGPMSGHFGNAYRAGDPLWHGSGRAVDWMGYNQDRLATFLAARRPLELIHRTKQRDYAYTRGRNKGSFNNALMEAHRNHIHIAMANGGVIREPILGVGASGRSYSFGERGPETVTPGAGGNTYNINVAVPVGAHPAEVGKQVVVAIQAYEQTNGRRWRQ